MNGLPWEGVRSAGPSCERRRNGRLRLQLPAAVFLPNAPRYVPFVLRDISMTGAFISSEVVVGPGERFVLSIRPPGTSSPIVAQARVVRITGEVSSDQADATGVGIVFTAMSRESYAALAEFWRVSRCANRDTGSLVV